MPKFTDAAAATSQPNHPHTVPAVIGPRLRDVSRNRPDRRRRAYSVQFVG